MAKETVTKHPRSGHVGLMAYDSANDRWQAVYVDPTGNLQVDVVASPDQTCNLYAWDGDSWEKVTIDASDHLQVAIADWPTAPTIYNVTMTNASTEYSQALPANTRKFLIKCRTGYDIQVCFANGQSGTTYLTVPAGFSYGEDQINDASITLYFQCATAGQVAEIVAWA